MMRTRPIVHAVGWSLVGVAPAAAAISCATSTPRPEAPATAPVAVHDVACPPPWLDVASLDPSIVPPDAGLLLHVAATGTQNYECAPAPDGGVPYAWKLLGPEAALTDCNGTPAGRHFASDAGSAAPEWQTPDGAYVIARKTAAHPAPDPTTSVPWLLLETTSHGGTGPLTATTWISRANTHGGAAPATPCTAAGSGTTTNVPYKADYYFWHP